MVKEKSMNSTDIFILTGELSGDLLGYNLLKHLSKKYTIEGVIGPKLKKLEIKQILPMDNLNFMGFSKPFGSIKKIISSINLIKKHIIKTNPKIVVLVDLPDINLRMAKKLRNNGYKGKIIQVVCPTIWAWRPKRKKILEKYYDHLFCLFPFEKELFKDSKLNVSYIGHPLKSLSARNQNKKNIIAIFPGSRKQEVNLLLPKFLKACEKFSDFEFHISVAKTSLLDTVKRHSKKSMLNIKIAMPQQKDLLIKECFCALSKNGTMNLELALSHVPQVSCYPLSFIEKFILEKLFSLYLPHYSLPNIILKKRVIPELIGPFATIENIEKELDILINNSYVKESMQSDYGKLSLLIKKDSCRNGSELLETELCN